MIEIAKIIKYHRKKAGLTQKELAQFAEVGRTVIHDIENGKQTIQLDTLTKILNVLNIKINFTSPLMEFYENEKS